MSTSSPFRKLLIIMLLFSAAALPVWADFYWEKPLAFVPQGMTHSISAAGKSFVALAWQEIRRTPGDPTSGDIYVSLAVSSDGIFAGRQSRRIAGPIHYNGVSQGNEPRVYSMTVDSRDRILVAVSQSDHSTVILQSVDSGVTFPQLHRIQSTGATGIPDLFTTGSGGLLLVMSEGGNESSVALSFSRSPDGRSWTDMAPLVSPADGVGVPQLQPSHATMDGREFVVFQAMKEINGIASSWQLYFTSSSDGGATWSKAVEITTATPLFGERPLGFNNQRPRIAALDGQLALIWERARLGDDRPTLFSVSLDARGEILGGLETPAADPPAQFPHILSIRGQEYMLYADASKGRSLIMLVQKVGKTWSAPQPLENTGTLNAVFPHAVVFNGSPFIFWENQLAGGAADSLVQLRPLTSVGAPVLKPVDFTPGELASKDTITVDWSESQPPDPAGIRQYDYTWSWSDGTKTVVKEKDTVSATSGGRLTRTRKLDLDGTWTFTLVAKDLAEPANVSPPASVSFTRDATPPRPVTFDVVGKDGNVLLTEAPTAPEKRDVNSFTLDTNTFTLRWRPSEDKDVVGYTINMQPGWTSLEDYRTSKVPLLKPPPRVVTTSRERPFFNADNGVYAVTVQAIDRAGNLSVPSTIALALTGYQLVTRVDFVTVARDPVLGTVRLTINGRGFTENGTLKKIVLDRRGARIPPWDMEFDPTALGAVTDRMISGITLDENRETGAYRVGLVQERPTGEALYFTPGAVVDFRSPGTVKIGNFELPLPSWIVGSRPRYSLPFNSLVVVLVVAFLGVLSFLSARKVFALAREGAAVRAEVVALLEGRPNTGWEERKNKMQALKRKGAGLRLKFTLLMVVLVFMIVLIVSIPLGLQMVSRQTLALASGLQNQAGILMDALASSAEAQFRLKDAGFEGARSMPNLRSAMTDATYTTITGPDPVANPLLRPIDPKDFVWASDQKRFADEYNVTRNFKIARETVDDELARSVVPQLQKKIDADAASKFSTLIDQERSLAARQQALLTKRDEESKKQLTATIAQLQEVNLALDAQAKAEFARSASLPAFDPSKALAQTYLFYRPVIYYNRAALSADTTFYQGLIRLEVKTGTITRQINDSILAILKIAGAIALAAIGLGVLGAIMLANITVTPIRKLAEGVAVIRDTEDRRELKSHTIVVRTRDEIGALAETVNEMTQQLVRAALADEELKVGKGVQKMFLPLAKDGSGKKGSTAEGEPKDKDLEIYGYYEGAAQVSGDYFDFKKLDANHYALIKCDVSGHGVSAGLIMVEVATLFISYFGDWAIRKASLGQIKDPAEKKRATVELERLDRLVSKINDMLVEREFGNLFAAFTIGLLNTTNGDITVCPAGDNEVSIYDASEGRMVHSKLTEKDSSPAAGMFPSDLVELKSGFPQYHIHLDHGDVLFLPTDGVDEAKRLLRDTSFNVIICKEPGLKEGEYHLGTHKFGTDNEDFGKERMDDFITGVFHKTRVRLVRQHNPIPTEELEFDFSSCEGTLKEVVLAVVSAEKVFRMVLDPKAGDGNRVLVDAKIDAFLKEHFLQYERYFSHRLEATAHDPYVHFSHLVEDEQRDDLTFLVVRRK